MFYFTYTQLNICDILLTAIQTGINMSKSINAVNENEFQVVTTTKDGKITGTETFTAEQAPDSKSIGRTLTEISRKEGSYRAAYQALVGLVLQSKRLDGFMGQGDKATGVTGKEVKAAVRDAETGVIETLITEGFIKLPKGDGQTGLQGFLSSLRDNKNYSNIKSTCVKYYSFVGKMPVTQSGRLVPHQVMLAEITNAINKDSTETTLATQISDLLDKCEKLDVKETRAALVQAKALYDKLNTIASDYAAQITGGDANAAHAANKAIASAGAIKVIAQATEVATA